MQKSKNNNKKKTKKLFRKFYLKFVGQIKLIKEQNLLKNCELFCVLFINMILMRWDFSAVFFFFSIHLGFDKKTTNIPTSQWRYSVYFQVRRLIYSIEFPLFKFNVSIDDTNDRLQRL